MFFNYPLINCNAYLELLFGKTLIEMVLLGETNGWTVLPILSFCETDTPSVHSLFHMKNNILLLYRKLIHSLSVKLININWQFIPEIYKETFTGLEKKDVCGQNITGNFFFYYIRWDKAQCFVYWNWKI